LFGKESLRDDRDNFLFATIAITSSISPTKAPDTNSARFSSSPGAMFGGTSERFL